MDRSRFIWVGKLEGEKGNRAVGREIGSVSLYDMRIYTIYTKSSALQ